MKRTVQPILLASAAILIISCMRVGIQNDPGSRVADHTVIDWVRGGRLPASAVNQAKASLHIGYGHTSHGSQLVDGMNGLVAFANGAGCGGAYSGNPDLFAWNRGGSGGALDLREGDGYGTGDMDHDCGYYDNTNNWVRETREYLDDPANGDINVIIWSWCGQAAGYSAEYMNEAYLDRMAELETEYPDVIFVYMTCHLNGSGPDGDLHQRNEQIRAFCASGNRWLFDFADIESFDPDGTAYNTAEHHADDACCYDADHDGDIETVPDNESTPEDESDPTTPIGADRNWARDWQAAHAPDTDWYDCGAAHSISLNANMKAYAAWWLWCRLAGWDGN